MRLLLVRLQQLWIDLARRVLDGLRASPARPLRGVCRSVQCHVSSRFVTSRYLPTRTIRLGRSSAVREEQWNAFHDHSATYTCDTPSTFPTFRWLRCCCIDSAVIARGRSRLCSPLWVAHCRSVWLLCDCWGITTSAYIKDVQEDTKRVWSIGLL